jgi:aldehyde dehydrogenase (NAD+)
VITGGKADRNELYFAPTILEDVNTEAPVMKEEISGPILPVFTFNLIHTRKLLE